MYNIISERIVAALLSNVFNNHIHMSDVYY